MRILVLRGSGNRHGSSAMLADEFSRGVLEAGHEVVDFDVAHADVRPCMGCNACGMAGPCVQGDDYEGELKGLIRDADMLAFAFPVYYYNWPAQMKAVVDRFYSFTGELAGMGKRAVLLTVAWDDAGGTFDVVEAYFDRICDYMRFEDCGRVVGGGCGTPSMTRATRFPGDAYELGRSL